MTHIGEKPFRPELFFRFVNVWIFDYITGKFLFVLQKDRQAENIWTPVGGEIDIPNTAEDQGLVEALGEVGVGIKVVGTIRVVELLSSKSLHWKKYHAHTEIFELFALLINGQPQPMQQLKEPEFEIVKLQWFSLQEFEKALQAGEINTYPNIPGTFKMAGEICTSSGNPFFKVLNSHKNTF